jgi:uncharacterized protein with HEPN domain
MPRSEQQYLEDIVESAGAISAFVNGLDQEAFSRDDLVRSAVAYKLLIIGEAATHLSGRLREENPGISWDDIVGFRTILAHVYFGLTWSRVHTTAVDHVPGLERDARRLLSEYPATEES